MDYAWERIVLTFVSGGRCIGGICVLVVDIVGKA